MEAWIGLHSELGGTFEAWKYNPTCDGSTDPLRNKKLPPGIHKVLTGSEDSDIHYYVLRPDLIANNRYFTLSRPEEVTAFNHTDKQWEEVILPEKSKLKVVGVLLIQDESDYLPEEPIYKYLFTMYPYTYIVINSEDKFGDKRTIKPSVGYSASAGGGASSTAAGSDASAIDLFRTPNSFKTEKPPPLTSTFGEIAAGPPQKLFFRPITGASLSGNPFAGNPFAGNPFAGKQGGARNPKKLTKKKVQKSRKSRKSHRKTSKSRKSHN